MSLNTLHLGMTLDFDTPEDQEESEELLVRLMGWNCLANLFFLRKNPDVSKLYDSHVVYTPPDQADGRPPLKRGDVKELLALLRRMGAEPETAMMIIRLLKGIEIFLDLRALYKRGRGDCNELVPVRIAELWRAGIAATPYLVCAPTPNARNGKSYHAVVVHPDGSAEDPSMILGMGGPERADERQEEIRKNAERIANYIKAGYDLKQIAAMGFFPASGTFKSPYTGGLQ